MSNIVTALKIQDASASAIKDPLVIMLGKELLDIAESDYKTKEDMLRILFKYSSMLSAVSASNVAEALLSPAEFDSMLGDIKEFSDMGDDILGE